MRGNGIYGCMLPNVVSVVTCELFFVIGLSSMQRNIYCGQLKMVVLRSFCASCLSRSHIAMVLKLSHV